MAIDVNYYDSVIYITSPTTTVTVQELIDAIRSAEDSDIGMHFGGPVKTVTNGFADAEGAVDVGGGYLNPVTITLDTNWYIEFWDGVNLGTVGGGNVAGGKDNRPIRAAPSSADTALAIGAERGIQSTSQVTSAEIADAVWDEPLSEHTSGGSIGEAQNLLDDIESDTSTIESKLPTNEIMGSSTKADMDDEIGAIKLKTDNLPSDPADQSQVETAITTAETNIRGTDSDTLKGISDQLDGVPGAVWDEDIDSHQNSGSFGEWLKKKLLTVSKFIGLS